MTGIPNWSPRLRVARFREYVEIVAQLLCNEVTTYEERFYKLKGAIMNPRPVQKPRPPIMIGALGRAMLKHTARYADTWNSIGSYIGTFEERLEATRRRNEFLDRYCEEIDWDPQSLRRSYLVFEPEVFWRGGLISVYESEEAFREMVERYVEVGITEFILVYPYREEQIPVFEKIAREFIPELKD